jgi:uncharacterized protein YndB with AHSA1/START domain
MNTTEFVYTTYIKTTPEKLWKAITTPEFTRQYWVEGIVSDWKKGSTWKHATDNYVMGGEVLESDPPRRLVMTWWEPDDGVNIARHSRVAFEIDAIDDMVRLNVIHNNLQPGSVMAGKISVGWPRVLSSLKSLLETGAALDTWAGVQQAPSPAKQGA